MTGHGCPACGGERGVDGRPGCACAEGAAETLHAQRSAEAAAAEDFDPLRIRPYVTLPNAVEGPPVAAPEAMTEQTMRLGAVPAEETPAAAPEPPGPVEAPRRRRRLAALAIGAAAAVAIGTAAFASTLFAGDAAPKRALPDVVDTGVPYSGTDSPSAEAPSAVPSRTKKAAPSRSPSARPSPTPSASKPMSPTPSKPAPTPSAPVSGPPSDSPDGHPLAPPPSTTLRRGDSGPAVLELQERLGQLGLYTGSPDGSFGSRTERAVRDFQSYTGIEGDPAGVYGPATRRALESMTDRP
ncbi:peptidoglycan-binding protein [Streptomyces violascens]|uniref:peptidoglycan-binding protein n=1 Tax=Streptomyces violascens TaxID=67381 RepID=UPI0037A1729E